MTPSTNSATTSAPAPEHRRLTPLIAIDPRDATVIRSAQRVAMTGGRPAARPMSFNSAL